MGTVPWVYGNEMLKLTWHSVRLAPQRGSSIALLEIVSVVNSKKVRTGVMEQHRKQIVALASFTYAAHNVTQGREPADEAHCFTS